MLSVQSLNEFKFAYGVVVAERGPPSLRLPVRPSPRSIGVQDTDLKVAPGQARKNFYINH